MANYSYKYPLLNDKEWLYQKYVVEQLSTTDMLKLIGAKTSNSICQALRKYDIEVRTQREATNLIKAYDGFSYNQEVLDGSLLGDGSLYKWNKFSDDSMPYFQKRNKYNDHIQYIAALLGLKEKSITYTCEKVKGVECDVYTLRSLSYDFLLPLYKKWYPESNGFKKIVPSDIIITPTVLLHWFMDDGCTWYRKDRKGTPAVGVFCSESFTKEENQMLIEKIYNSTGLKLTHTKSNSGTTSRISIPTLQLKSFFEVIGSCPIECFKYKWKG